MWSAVSNQALDARSRWNRRYARRGVDALERPPSAWLLEHRALLPDTGARRALDVACGKGRNAAYLARLGFEVDAVDISDVAIDALRAAAADQRLAVRACRLDLERSELPVAAYDVIVQINYLQRSLFGPLAQALKPGGILLLQTFSRADTGQPGDGAEHRFLLDRNELLSSFPDLDVVDHRAGVAEHAGTARATAGLVARRPTDRGPRRATGERG